MTEKISDSKLLSTILRDAFDGSELKLLTRLLENEIEDWVAERRARYEPLLKDLEYLADRAYSNGLDYGWRVEPRWAPPDPVAENPALRRMTIKVVCYCGTTIEFSEEQDLRKDNARPWTVVCPRHEGPRPRTLGTLSVSGIPKNEIHAKLALQQFLGSQEQGLRRGQPLKGHVRF